MGKVIPVLFAIGFVVTQGGCSLESLLPPGFDAAPAPIDNAVDEGPAVSDAANAESNADSDSNDPPLQPEPDCNQNGVPDELDIANGTSQDCNGDGLLDECDFSGRMDPPPIQCPADVTIACDASSDPSDTGVATSEPICDPDPTIGFFDLLAPGSCPDEMVITRIWSVVDSSGNISSCDQFITVRCCSAPP